tara:strand:+ start:6294 stop:7415 length:1122 start_codon:yes stop_codon:yes gene_type:complete
MQSKKIKIIHFITTLGLGGAERVLYNILKHNKYNKFEHQVICLNSGGYLKTEIQKLNIKINCLNLNKNFFLGIIRCFVILNSFKNKKKIIIQTWLPHADLLGGLISKMCGYKKIIWNIRIANFSKNSFKYRTLIIILINSLLSYFIPKKIISCSNAGIKAHCRLGYNKNLFHLINNGFDKVTIKKRSFKFTKKFTLGIFSRYHKVKNHEYLLRALSVLKKKEYQFKLLLLGPNINFKNKKLIQDIKSNNLNKESILITKKGIFDVNRYFSYIDLYILCSHTEGFPNILGEAIINGVNVMSTDVGDAKLMLPAKTNLIPKNNHLKFAKKIESLIKTHAFKKKRSYLLKKNSLLFYKKYSQNKMITNYQKLWVQI